MMRIDNWGLGQIMQLPDNLFGRQFAVCCHVEADAGVRGWDISEVGLPERCVIWQFVIRGTFRRASADTVRVALGDQLPAAAAEMDRLEPLISGLGAQGAGPRVIALDAEGSVVDLRLRMAVAAMGRRLVVELNAAATDGSMVDVHLVVSGVPKEIPEWMGLG